MSLTGINRGVPFKWLRAIAYAATLAFAIVGGSACINCFVKAHNEVHRVIQVAEAESPFPGVTVVISISDLIGAGAFLATGEVLLGITSYISLLTLLPWILPFGGKYIQRVVVGHRHHPHGDGDGDGHGHEHVDSDRDDLEREREKRGWEILLGFWLVSLVWTLVSAAVSLDWALHRHAKTSAYLDGVKIPDDVVRTLQKQLGLRSDYWVHGYTRFFAIAPWPLILTALISIALTFPALRRPPSPSGVPVPALRNMGSESNSIEKRGGDATRLEREEYLFWRARASLGVVR